MTAVLSLFLILNGPALTADQLDLQGRPNFIFILTDDQPYGFMGCTGNSIVNTPNLDKLAADGVLFTNAHVTSAICTPSRTSIVLSQFERKHGVNFNSGTSLSEEAWKDAYPVQLRKNGYYSGWIGKNHIPIGPGGYRSGVMEESFDYWYAGHGHLGFYPKDRHAIFHNAKSDTQVEVIGEGVKDFLTNSEKLDGVMKFVSQRPDDQPFVLSVCFNLPHGAGTSSMQQREGDPEIYKSLYRDVELPMPKNYLAKSAIKSPKLPPDLHRSVDRQSGYDYVDTEDELRERYLRMLQAMTGIDEFVGEMRSALDDQGLSGNTIIVFTSDHGLFLGQYGLGGKAYCYEQVTHVPLIVYNPKERLENRGRKIDALVQTLDIAPTLLQFAGIEIPETYQGKSLLKMLSGKESDIREFSFSENLWSTQFGHPRCESVQSKDWKYIRYYKNQNFSASKKIKTARAMGIPVNSMLYKVHDPDIAVYRDFIESPLSGEEPAYEELYDLRNDPHESTNLAGQTQYQELLQSMRQAWCEEIIKARGQGAPAVTRYTADSEAEQGIDIEPK